MHAYAVLFMIGVPLLLGPLWGRLGVVLFLPLMAARALGEEAMLRDGAARLSRLRRQGVLPTSGSIVGRGPALQR